MDWRLRRVVLGAWDAVVWAIALALALALRYEFDLDPDDVAGLVRLIAVAVVAQILIGGALQVYRGRHWIGSIDDAVDTAASIGFTGAVVFVANVLLPVQLAPRSVAIIATPIALLLAVGSRIAVRFHHDRSARPDNGSARRVILFGAGVEGQQVLRTMLADPDGQYLPVAFLDDDPRRRGLTVSGVAVQGTGADIAEVAARSRADLLAITDHHVDTPSIRAVSSAAARAGLEVKVVAPLTELLRPVPAALLTPSATSSAGDGPLVPRAVPRSHSRAKRCVDVALSSAALVLCLPLLVAIAVVLALSNGEVLYRAPRVGRGGRIFTMYKFSTMVPVAGGPRVTRATDPRITPVGRWLRATKLNELPQLVNVLTGDMSLVGPRPEDPRYVAFYSSEQREVLSVRPGMASSAFLVFGDEEAFIERVDPPDVETYYLNELLPEKLDIELRYVRNWTMRDDLRILAGTVKGLLG
jgi:lipopolysaccharide/colanic/teichoic acid biosynthesis glycosyltransferase